MNNPRTLPRRILSPFHCDELDELRLERELWAAEKFGFNEIHIGGAMHDDAMGNLDGLVEYEGFLAIANSLRPMARILRQQRILNRFCERAAGLGIRVYYWHHELWFPTAIRKQLSRHFTAKGQTDPFSTFTRDYLRSRYQAGRRQLPGLSGLIMTFAETTQVIYQNGADMDISAQQSANFLSLINSEVKDVGWDWVLRIFCWQEHEYVRLRTAIRKLSFSPTLMVKSVPMDWHLHFPVDKTMQRFPDNDLIVELGTNNEYWGVNRTPCVNPEHYVSIIEHARKKVTRFAGVSARTDRDGNSVWETPNSCNLMAVGLALNGTQNAARAAVREFLSDRFGVSGRNLRRWTSILKQTGIITAAGFYERGRHLNGTYIGHLTGFHNLWAQARPLYFEPGDESFRAARKTVELAAQELLSEVSLSKGQIPPSEYLRFLKSCRLLQSMVQVNTLYCELLYGVRCAHYEQKWRTSEAWAPWKTKVTALSNAMDREFGSDLLGHGIFAPGESFAGPVGERMRAWIDQLETLLPHLELRKKGANLLKKILPSIEEIEYISETAFKIGPGPACFHFSLKGDEPAILVVRVGAHMAEARPAEITFGTCPPFRKDFGVFNWFKCCEGFRTYEFEVPPSAIEGGQLSIRIKPLDERIPLYFSLLRIDRRISGVPGEILGFTLMTNSQKTHFEEMTKLH